MRDKINKLEHRKEELKRKQDDINKQIKLIKSRERHEEKKKENHYKILLGAFFLNELATDQVSDDMKRKLKSFINNDEKFNAIAEFINTHKNHQTDNQ